MSRPPRRPTQVGPSLLSHVLVAVAVCALGAAIYADVIDAPFVLDDAHNIEENPHLRIAGRGLAGLVDAAWGSPSGSRPVANASFALNYALTGPGTAGFRATNVVIHLLASLCVYGLALTTLRRLPAQPGAELRDAEVHWIAALAALLFVAHPIQVQSVTYIVQRMTSLAALFYLLALWCFALGRARAPGGARWGLWLGALVAWGLALGTKQNAATLPIAVLLYELFFFRDLDVGWLGRQGALLAAGVALLGAVALVYLGADFARIAQSYEGRPFGMGERVLTQLRVVPFYVGLIAWPLPSRLNLLHGFETSRSLVDPPTTLLSLLVLVGALVAAIALARRQRLLSFCILWFFLQLAIESSVIGLEMVFEHRLYLPMFGATMIAAYGLVRGVGGRRALVLVIGALVVCGLAAAAHQRNAVWHDRITLWSDVVAKNPTSPRAHNSLGRALEQAGRVEAAVSHFEAALRLEPDHMEAHYNLGVIALQRGDVARAQRHLREALRIDPGYARAHNNLAAALLRSHEVPAAIEHLREAVRLDPYHANAHFNLAVVLEQSGRGEEALDYYAKALALNPADGLARDRQRALQQRLSR